MTSILPSTANDHSYDAGVHEWGRDFQDRGSSRRYGCESGFPQSSVNLAEQGNRNALRGAKSPKKSEISTDFADFFDRKRRTWNHTLALGEDLVPDHPHLFVRIGRVIEGGASGPLAIITFAIIIIATLLIFRL
jgi:hypothetical protein